MRARARQVLLLALSVAAPACGGVRVADQRPQTELAWPAGDPRIRLERVIELRRRSSGIGLLLGGAREQGLFSGPYAATWQGDDLWVSDSGSGRVLRVAAGGRVTESPEQLVSRPLALAACGAGVLVADAERGEVGVISADLRSVRRLATGLERPTGLACSGDAIFVVETARHRIVALAGDGSRRSFGERGGGPGQFNFPAALTASGDALYVGDTLNFRIQVLAADDGRFRSTFGRLGDSAGDTPRIKGIAIAADGNVWVTDAHLDQVALYTPGGALLMTLGRHGTDPGEFLFPAGLAAHRDGRVAVVDALNRRVQIFRLLQRAQ